MSKKNGRRTRPGRAGSGTHTRPLTGQEWRMVARCRAKGLWLLCAGSPREPEWVFYDAAGGNAVGTYYPALKRGYFGDPSYGIGPDEAFQAALDRLGKNG